MKLTRMWANAQRDGRPAEYRWRPLFNAGFAAAWRCLRFLVLSFQLVHEQMLGSRPSDLFNRLLVSLFLCLGTSLRCGQELGS